MPILSHHDIPWQVQPLRELLLALSISSRYPMRQPRLIRHNGEAFFHCISRIVDKQFLFEAKEKRFFLGWMRKLERFSGVQVVTYCLMSNHFHLLLRVPDKSKTAPLDETTLRELLPVIYRNRHLTDAVQELDRARASAESGNNQWMTEILARYELRRHDLSSFLKDLKQRFTQWYNQQHDRCGTLWEGRFKSVLVETGEQALLTIAAYIDLNPIRAGLVSDPSDYPWCGYAAAVAGKSEARAGLSAILQYTSFGVNRRVTWSHVAPKYRTLMFLHGEQCDADAHTGSKGRRGLSQQAVADELRRGGEISLAQALRCKTRYFCDGVVLGSEEFVNQIFAENRERCGPRRKTGARKMVGVPWKNLHVLRDLKRNIFG